MNLTEKLARLKKNIERQTPKEAVEIMHRATEDLRNSSILDHTVKAGNEAPDFSLQNTDGKEFRLKELLVNRPIVLSFYRGKW